ncbi:MAG TPA: hypothetical protein VF073_07345 [Gaiella sp.]
MTAVLLKGEELEVARAEVEAVRAAVGGDDYGEVLDGLLRALGEGVELEERQADELDRLLTLALQSGRGRALYGPGGEQAALRAFRKLPTGADLAQSAAAVNDALAALGGRAIERLSLTAVGPGAFTLAVATDGPQLSIRLDRQGARVTSVEA